jgi:hypothetical protein
LSKKRSKKSRSSRRLLESSGSTIPFSASSNSLECLQESSALTKSLTKRSSSRSINPVDVLPVVLEAPSVQNDSRPVLTRRSNSARWRQFSGLLMWMAIQ